MSTNSPKKKMPPASIPHAEPDSTGLSSGEGNAPSVPGPASTEPVPEQKPTEPLGLPKGAFIAFRKSGGLKFSTSEMLLYPDGHITYGGAELSRDARTRSSRRLNDAQIMRLRRLLDQSGFFGMKPAEASQSPDTFAYEVAARVGSKHNAIELFTGTIPEAMQALIEQLEKLLPTDE